MAAAVLGRGRPMRRREFITLLGGAAAPWPLVARAQQRERRRRIGVLLPFVESDSDAKAQIAAFEDGLRKLGWEKDQNIAIDYRWAGSNQRLLQTDAGELVGTAPDVLFAAAVPPLVALSKQTHSIPIVFVQVSDPVKLELVASLEHPGGNITGFVNFEHSIAGRWLELLKSAAPKTSRVAVIFDPQNPAMIYYLDAIKAAAPSFGVQLISAGVRNSDEIERVMETFANQPDGALIALPNAVTILHRDLIISLAAKHRLPAMYVYRLFTSDGGLISYGVDLADLYRRAATYVDRILKGAKPANLPVQLPTKFELVINLKTAKALGLSIPQALLATADEVIE
jgi:putative tryptophan/tyrosine transport system substrate-binding protein